MNGGPDDGLRARFDALREADGRRVPAFRAMLGRRAHASPPAALPRRAWLRALVLAAAAAIVLALGLTITPGRGDFAPQPLSTWTSPTASLLRTPGSDLLASPGLVASPLDQLITTLAQREGN